MRVSVKKKNDEVASLTFDTDFALPEFVATVAAPQPSAPIHVPTPAPTTVMHQAPQQSAQPEVAKAVGEVSPKPGAQPMPSVEATTESKQRRAVRRSSSASVSIHGLLNGDALTATEMAEQEAAKGEEVFVDPSCEEKISLKRDAIVERIKRERPRISVAFLNFEVVGNVVKMAVPSRELHDEIMYEKADLQRIIAEISGVKGLIEIAVDVNEQIKASRPITLEDRLKHLVAKNERLVEMIERMNLDAE